MAAGPDIRGWESVLIHDVDAFTEEGIKERADALEAPADRVEVFAWLLEISAQAAEAAGELDEGGDGLLILRGGTSAQVRVGEGRQRGSADVDVLVRGSLEDAERVIERMNQRLAICAPFLQFVEFARTEKPLKKFRAWSCFIPRLFASALPGREEDPGRAVLFEVHAIEGDVPPPAAPLVGSAFGLALNAEVKALTAGALIGDKLDCVSPPSPIGIEGERFDKHARHIYDLTMLRETHEVNAAVLEDAALTVAYFTRRDAELREYEAIAPAQTMLNAERFLADWGWPKVPGSPAKDQIARARGFEQNVPKELRVGDLGWSMRALQAALLARAVRETLELTADEAAARHRARLRQVKKLIADGAPVADLADSLVGHLDEVAGEPLTPGQRKQARNQLLPRGAPENARERVVMLAVVVLGDEAIGLP